jgi:hypothetical protein
VLDALRYGSDHRVERAVHARRARKGASGGVTEHLDVIGPGSIRGHGRKRLSGMVRLTASCIDDEREIHLEPSDPPIWYLVFMGTLLGFMKDKSKRSAPSEKPVSRGDALKAWAQSTIKEAKPTPPPNVKTSDLKGLSDADREYVKKQGKSHVMRPHNPPNFVDDEPSWERAKKIVKDSGKWEDYDEPWAVVSHVYQNIAGSKA